MGCGIAAVCDRAWVPPVVAMVPDDGFRRLGAGILDA